MRSTKKAFILSVFLSMFIGSFLYGCAPDIQRTGVEGLGAIIGDQDVVIVDVRSQRDWNASDEKIKGALRGNPFDVKSWADSLPKDKTIVLYCAWPDELSSVRAAQELKRMGFEKVRVLKGGWNAWLKAGYPVEKK